jgi:hypothetical protein
MDMKWDKNDRGVNAFLATVFRWQRACIHAVVDVT